MPLTLTTSSHSTVTDTSQTFGAPMVAGNQYLLRSSVNCWFRVGPSDTVEADEADGSHYLIANMPVYLAARGTDDTVAIIRDSGGGDGVATLSLVEPGSLT